jgi:hypothetical protein
MRITQDCVDLVMTLNQELFENFGDEVPNFFEYQTDGHSHIIKFAGTVLWNSEDDERLYLDESDSYEPLEPFVRREFNRLMESIKKLKL